VHKGRCPDYIPIRIIFPNLGIRWTIGCAARVVALKDSRDVEPRETERSGEQNFPIFRDCQSNQ
jgi:hypothetical protein